jgi:hypothetical protein
MQIVLVVPKKRKRIALLPGITMQYNSDKTEITYTADDFETLKWQLLANMSERDALKLLMLLETQP